MRLKIALSLAAAAGLLWLPKPAPAAVNLFFPFSGYRFTVADVFTVPLVAYSDGRIRNVSSGGVNVQAPLGHASGGANGFTIYGNVSVPNTQVSCSIFVTRQQDNLHLTPFSAITPVLQPGRYSLFVRATPPSGNYFYSLMCSLPVGGDIKGVRPDA